MIGVSVPGRSLIHRIPAGVKLLGLSLACIMLIAVSALWQLAVAAVITLMLFVIARLPAVALWSQLRPVLWIVLLAFPLNAIWLSLADAMLISGRVALALALAALFSMTTPVSEVLDVCERFGSRVLGHSRADRIGLMVALTIRSIPILSTTVRESSDARKARGAENSLRALAVPIIVRTLKSADQLGESLRARGVDD